MYRKDLYNNLSGKRITESRLFGNLSNQILLTRLSKLKELPFLMEAGFQQRMDVVKKVDEGISYSM